ncbi:hypothetical protein [Cellulosimicrobium sp. CUA-896]|nr:hypothetical protein [Cellulosimicrobium sp. CUA-896]
MSTPFGPAFEAELSYRQQQLRDDYQRGEPVLLHWLRHRRHRHGGPRR